MIHSLKMFIWKAFWIIEWDINKNVHTQYISYIRSQTGIQYSIISELPEGFERKEYTEMCGKYWYADTRNIREAGGFFYKGILIGDLYSCEECLMTFTIFIRGKNFIWVFQMVVFPKGERISISFGTIFMFRILALIHVFGILTFRTRNFSLYLSECWQ